jgi:hypothetical protein
MPLDLNISKRISVQFALNTEGIPVVKMRFFLYNYDSSSITDDITIVRGEISSRNSPLRVIEDEYPS